MNIEAAVKFINDKYENNTTEMALEIGGYVFENFYESDPEAVSSKDPKKKTSFNKMCKHPEMGMERSQLNRMVNAFIQEGNLKEGGVDCDKLKYSHRVELLKIKDGEAKIVMAKKCIDESLSIRELRDEMSKTTGDKEGCDGCPLKITSQTMVRFEASEKAIAKIDQLIAEADVKDLVTVTRNKLHEKATALQKHMEETSANLVKLIGEIDAITKK
jgi:hypothetical protein